MAVRLQLEMAEAWHLEISDKTDDMSLHRVKILNFNSLKVYIVQYFYCVKPD